MTETAISEKETWLSSTRKTRTIFVFGFTALFAALAAGITLMGYQGTVPERAVDGFLGAIELMIIFFLPVEAIDRSQILNRLGTRITGKVSQTPEQARAAANTTPEPKKEDESAG